MATIDLTKYPISTSSTIDPDWGIVQDIADSGVLYRRELFSAPRFIVNASWDLLDLTGRDNLESLLLRYRMEQFTFDLDGHTYTGDLLAPPTRRYVSGTLYAISAAFRATRVTAVDPIAALVDRIGATAIWYDPLNLSSVRADTAGITSAAVSGAVARIDSRGAKSAPHWQDTSGSRPILRADGIEYDGTDDNLVYPDDHALRFGTTSFTVALAVRPDVVTGDHGLLSKRGTGAAGTNPGWGVRQNAASVLVEYDYTGASSGPTFKVASGVLSASTWTRVIIEVDRVALKARAYINGVLQASPPTIPSGDISGTRALTMGRSATADQPFDGKLGRMLVSGSLLSDSDRTTVDDWLLAGFAA